MQSFKDAITRDDPGGWTVTPDGRAVLTLAGDTFAGDIYTVELEPLMFGQYYIAVYRDGELLANKVPVRPGGPKT